MIKKLCTLLALAFCLNGKAQVCFNLTDTFTVAHNPLSVTCADFNRDGHPDLATVDSSNTISLLFGKGFGAFNPAINFTVNANTYAIASADFNGDLYPDIVTANKDSNNVSILLNTGSGSFGAATNFMVGTAPLSLVIVDLNFDGKKDVATANSGSNNISLLWGTGTGSFTYTTAINAGTNPRALVSNDFNYDGKPDLAVANFGSNTVGLYLGNGTGGFSIGSYSVGSGPCSLTSADFNHDFYDDLAVANYNSNTVTFIYYGVSSTTTDTVGTSPISIVNNDFNGDGYSDVAVANYGSNNISVLLSNGGKDTTYPVGNKPVSIVLGEFNEDANEDIAVADFGTNKVSVLLGTETGRYGDALSYPVTGSGNPEPVYIVSADFNNDGKADIATSNSGTNNITVLLDSIAGSFGTATIYTTGGSPQAMCSADFNNDGNADLAIGNYNPFISILLGTGTGSFGPATNYTVGTGANINVTSIISDDFNNDGNADLAFRGFVMLSNGTGGFTATSNVVIGSPLVSADFNNDGYKDLATVGTVFLNSGTGSFTNALYFNSGGSSSGIYPSSIASADFNGDGKADLVNSNYGGVFIYLGTSNGSMSSYTSVTAQSYASVISKDFNGDGKMDLALANDGMYASVLLGNGDGSFSNLFNYAIGINDATITSGDFNGDGKPDLAVPNFYSGTVSVLLNCTPTPTCVAWITDSLFKDAAPLTWDLLAHYSPQVTSAKWFWGDGTFSTGLYPSHTYSVAGRYSICATVYTSCGDSASTCRNDTIYRVANTTSGAMVYVNIIGSVTSVSAVTSTICTGNTDTLTASGATSYTWSPTIGLSSSTGSMVLANPSVTTTYTVTGAIGTSLVDAIITVMVNPLPTITINVSNAFCIGDTITLIAIGANTYMWSTGETTPSISVTPTFSITMYSYTVTGANGNGCSNSASITGSLTIDCTGIQQFTNSNELTTIYPNPNNGSFVIEPNSSTKQTMHVYDVNGKLLVSQIINGKTSIDASSLNEGVYNISLQSNEGIVNKRLVIVR